MEVKTYNAVFDPKKHTGVFAIGLVNDPAMESNFVALAKEKVEFKTINEEKRILLGLLMQPDKVVPRYSPTRGNYNIVFSKETIRDLAYAYMQNGFQNNASLEHEEPIKGVTLSETWLVEDPQKDKSAIYGMEYPVGSWLGVLKVNDDDIWDNYVKTGQVLGFSIEGSMDFSEQENLNQVNMNSIVEAIKEGFKAISLNTDSDTEIQEEVKMGNVVSGDTTISFDGDTLEEGTAVYILSDTDDRVAVPEGAYELEDGRTLNVDDSSTVTSVEDAPTGEDGDVEQPSESEMMSQEDLTAIAEVVKEQMQELKTSLAAEFEEKLSGLKKENAELVEKVEVLSAQPASKAVGTVPTQKHRRDMNFLEYLKSKSN